MEINKEIIEVSKRVSKMLDDARKLHLESFGVSLEIEASAINRKAFISIMDYNGYSIIELTPKEIKELKKFVSKL